MINFLIAVAIASTPISAQKPNEVTIVVDMTAQCHMGRIADDKNAIAKRQAKNLARELRAQGKSVRIVNAYGTHRISASHQIDVRAPSC